MGVKRAAKRQREIFPVAMKRCGDYRQAAGSQEVEDVCGERSRPITVFDHLETRAFPRLRFGIGRPEPGDNGDNGDDRADGADPLHYVLAPFSAAEERQIGTRIDLAVAALETLLRDGASIAMNEFNRPPEQQDLSSAPGDGSAGE